MVGCLAAVASGGGGSGCKAGAISGAVGALGTPLIATGSVLGNAAAHGLIGGLASVAGGGKFENGAVTAAFGYLFNATYAVTHAGGVAGAWLGGLLGTGASALCTWATAGGCAAAIPYITSGSIALGRFGGAWAAGSIEDWVFSSNAEDEKSIRSFERLISEHEKKLNDYREDPDKFDNQGRLKNAPNDEIREQIIEGRIEKLQREIDGFRRQLDNLLGKK